MDRTDGINWSPIVNFRAETFGCYGIITKRKNSTNRSLIINKRSNFSVENNIHNYFSNT